MAEITAYGAALQAYKRSQEYRTSREAHSLGHSIQSDEYLGNRLISAFEAGWNARDRVTSLNGGISFSTPGDAVTSGSGGT